MAFAKTTQAANRYGMNLKFYEYDGASELTDLSELTPLTTIDFANEVSFELSSDLTWATGGQAHSNKVGFSNPYEGTLSISTQLTTMELLTLISGNDMTEATTEVTFKNATGVSSPKCYMVAGDTVYADKDGNVYDEYVVFYKVCVKPNYSVSYTGDGDPQSIDVEFDLAPNDNELVCYVKRADQATA